MPDDAAPGIPRDETTGVPLPPVVSESAPAAPVADPASSTTFMATTARAAYLRSQTFLGLAPAPAVVRLRILTIGGLLALFFAVIPALNMGGVIPKDQLNILGKYLCFSIAALGVDLIWGYTGLLSLCQALFFCLGGYVMAMHLSLPQGGGDVRPDYNNLPQFMFFNNTYTLPFFWRPMASFPLTLVLGVLVAGVVGTAFGFFILRSRIRGVYFSIVTQAVAWGAWLLISRNEMLMGGTNGLTNFYKPLTENSHFILGLYLVTAAMVVLAYLLCLAIVRSRLGRILVAVRDKETRLYFAGYKPYAFKVFAFAVAAMLAAVGGMLYSPQVTMISPQNMDVKNSIEIVLCVAIGGRGKLWGGILGALVFYYLQSAMSSDFSGVWQFIYGALFILVVLVFPDGFVGMWSEFERQIASGERWTRCLVTILPVAAICLFILLQATGMMPWFLDRPVWSRAGPNAGLLAVKWKYWLLVTVLAGDGIAYWVQTRARRIAGSRGFPIAVAAAA